MPFSRRSGARQAARRGLVVVFGLICMPPTLTASEQTTNELRTGQRNMPAALGPSPRDQGLPSGNLPIKNATLEDSKRTGNPLWAVPLESLSATQQRPIFSPSRRPRPAVAALPIQAAPPPPPVEQPRAPLLALVGVIASGGNSIAILVDETTKAVIRLKAGESHSGWTLSSVERREVTLEKDRRIAILSLPNRMVK
jgi:hypothetical protein